MPNTNNKQQDTNQLDAAGKSLSEALRISFIALKIIMVVLVGLFLISGFETVGSDEQALILRFGKIQGAGESRVLKPRTRPYWVFPYPVEQIIKIPVAKKLNLATNSFWYYQRPDEMLPQATKDRRNVKPVLYPARDGYCITRSEKQSRTITGSTGSDYNIVHCKWQLTYQIDDPERFFKNVHTGQVKPGESYLEIMTKSITPLLEHLLDDAVVTAMVNYTIDEVMFEQVAGVTKHVKKLLQKKLNKIESGIKVVSVQLTQTSPPRQVDYAFLASIKASQESQKTISQAKGYAENALNEVAGPVAAELLEVISAETISEQEEELLWSRLAGTSQEKIAQARAYRTEVVETAKANAEYLQRMLPEYRKRPKLVLQKIYQDAIEHVLNNADEKIIIQSTKGAKDKEFRILINRDPTIKPADNK